MLANELANRSKQMIDKTKYNYTVEICQIFTFEDMTIVLDIKQLYGHEKNIHAFIDINEIFHNKI